MDDTKRVGLMRVIGVKKIPGLTSVVVYLDPNPPAWDCPICSGAGYLIEAGPQIVHNGHYVGRSYRRIPCHFCERTGLITDPAKLDKYYDR